MMAHVTIRYPQLELDAQLCLPLYAASRAVTRRYGDLLADAGLTYPQYLTMLALWGGAPLTVGDIGTRLHLDTGTLTPLLKRLEQAGLVVRRRDPADERRVLIEPTTAGWALREQVTEVPGELGESIGLSEDEARQLHQLLYRVIGNLGGPLPLPLRRGEVREDLPEPAGVPGLELGLVRRDSEDPAGLVGEDDRRGHGPQQDEAQHGGVNVGGKLALLLPAPGAGQVLGCRAAVGRGGAVGRGRAGAR
jgi:DNA-binding MarR family transcriptional regulator